MPVLLSVAGAIAIVAAVLMLASPLTNAGVRAGPAEVLIQAITPGVLAFIGGCLLLGLGAALTRLARIQETLEMHPMARGPAAVPPLAPAPPVAETEQPAPAAPPLAVPPPPAVVATPPDPPPPPNVAPPVQPPAAEPAEPDASSAPPVQAGERMALSVDDKAWPGSDMPVEKKEARAPAVEPASPPPLPAPPAAPLVPPGPVRVLKSGVIEGMAYTLYSDGSVDADLPEGTMHFASIAEWRAHLRVGA